MKRWDVVDRALTPEGTPLTLSRSGGEFLIRANGRGLMGSAAHGSEETLATLGCARARALPAPRVLVGGLGMGYTLRATLDALPAHAEVVVSELIPAVVTWNHGPLAPLAAAPLADPRVRVALGDVAALLDASPAAFDAILLDVDNGPVAFAQEANAGLYGRAGIARCRAALAPRGVLAVWSAGPDAPYLERLRRAGFTATAHTTPAHPGRRAPEHTIFVALLR